MEEDATPYWRNLPCEQAFCGIDTANQRRHYDEAAVGSAISTVVADGLLARDDVFVQTKFTFPHGPDHRVPDGADAPIAVQVEQSLASSPRPSGHRYDGLLLWHGPTKRTGLAAGNWEAWRAMEALHDNHRVRREQLTLEPLQLRCKQIAIRSRVGVRDPSQEQDCSRLLVAD